MRSPVNVCIACLLAVPVAAHAARPFVTDDARLSTAGSCQLESWSRVHAHSVELWALPACNPYGDLEFTAGVGIAKADAGTSDYVFQLKTLFRPLDTHDWGWGVAVGTVRHPAVNPGPNLLGNSYVYVPLSRSLLDDRIVLHVNAGMLHDRQSDRSNLTWGVGAEVKLGGAWTGIVETFGDNRDKPFWQVGARYALVPDRVQIDATIGQQFAGPGDSQWFSLGLRLTPDRLF
ncbi:hypothetical protein [Methyloversatilis thermotolerans]|uniref:hypothetical protein n=1 Tax=Methyloversatilis thermotolerans TaxID=1346290 RepID=UPI0004757EB3|nr:hypothetical protein [Methyloversatilis thermotolerans]